MLEALIGVRLLTRTGWSDYSLHPLSDYLRLIALGGGVASIAGAAIGALVLLLSNYITPSEYIGNALIWWIGDTLGIILVTPLILVWWDKAFEQLSIKQVIEGLLLIGLTLMVRQIVFLGWLNPFFPVKPKAFIMFLFITWIAISFGKRVTTIALMIIAIQALSGVFIHAGYFSDESGSANFHNYWLYMLTLSLVGMAIAVYVDEINKKKHDLHENEKCLRLSQINGGYRHLGS